MLHSAYIIHSFSIWVFPWHLRSDVPELIRNVKLCTSNLSWIYIQHKYNIWQHNPMYHCSHTPTVLSMHTTVFRRCVVPRMRTYPYHICRTPTVPLTKPVQSDVLVLSHIRQHMLMQFWAVWRELKACLSWVLACPLYVPTLCPGVVATVGHSSETCVLSVVTLDQQNDHPIGQDS